MIEKIKSNSQLIILLFVLALVITLVLVFNDKLPKYERPAPDPERAYHVTIETTPNAPLFNEDYYCAYYKLDDRTITMYTSDCTVRRVIVINVNANCKIRKTY